MPATVRRALRPFLAMLVKLLLLTLNIIHLVIYALFDGGSKASLDTRAKIQKHTSVDNLERRR